VWGNITKTVLRALLFELTHQLVCDVGIKFFPWVLYSVILKAYCVELIIAEPMPCLQSFDYHIGEHIGVWHLRSHRHNREYTNEEQQ
jgi:hypothetical protein